MTSDDQLPARFRRERPNCLDVVWSPDVLCIWHEDESTYYEMPRNRIMRFRRVFELETAPSSARLRILVDSRYLLYLNGEYLGRGPSRYDPRWTYYDAYDLTERLRPGRNCLAALGLHYGFGTGSHIAITQALLAQLDLTFPSGETRAIVSDEQWKASPAPGHVSEAPRINGTQGCMEVWDLREADPGWTEADYDDGDWAATRSSTVTRGLRIYPYYHLVERDIPVLEEVDRPARGVVGIGTAPLGTPPVARLGRRHPSPDFESVELQTFPVHLPPGPGEGIARVATVDLGRVDAGLIRLDIEGSAGAVVDIVYGEVLVEGTPPPFGMVRDRTPSDRFVLREGRQELAPLFDWQTFRYAQLWIWSSGPVIVHDAWLRAIHYPVPETRRFECDDAFLNRLDEICDHTLRICMQDGYLDSSSREQQQYIGDGRKQAIFNHYRFGDAALHRRLIEQTGQSQDWTGSVEPRWPARHETISPIPAYCLFWVVAMDEYFWFTGDDRLAEAWWPNVTQTLRWFTAFENDEGLLRSVPFYRYIDEGARLPSGLRLADGEFSTPLNLYYLAALATAVKMAGRVGDDEAAGVYRRKQERLAQAIRGCLWDEARGAYADVMTAGRFGTVSEVTGAAALLWLEREGGARAERMIEALFERPDEETLPVGPFNMYDALEALSLHGRADLALDLVRKRYREQIEQGATTLWEHWTIHLRDPEGRPLVDSSSHAWGAAPIAFFANTILGVRPTAPGWARARVAPQPLDLRRAGGEVRTARGSFEVDWRRGDGVFRLDLEAPEGIEVEAVLPDGTSRAVSGQATLECADGGSKDRVDRTDRAERSACLGRDDDETQ